MRPPEGGARFETYYLELSFLHDVFNSFIERSQVMEDYVASCFKEYEENPYILLPYKFGYAETLS